MVRRLLLIVVTLAAPVALAGTDAREARPTPTAERIELNRRFAALNRKLAESPDDVAALVDRGRIRLALDDLTGAVTDLNRALELAPANVDVLIAHGAAMIRDGRTPQAVTELTRALELAPGNAEAHKTLGTAYASQMQLPRAIEEYSKALTLDPRMTAALFNRAVVRRQSGDLAGALADADQLVALEPGRSDSYLLRASILLEKKEPARAIVDYDKAVALDPADPRVYEGRARARQLAGDKKGSAEDFARAERAAPPPARPRPTPVPAAPGEARIVAPGQGERIRLRLALPPGGQFRFRSTQKPVSSLGPVPQGLATTQKSRQLLSVGTATGSTPPEVTTLLEDVEMSGGPDAATFMTRFRSKVIGLKTTARYSATGHRSDWKVVNPPKGELANIVSLMTRGQADRDLGFLGVIYPEGDVAPGARWQVSLDLRPSLAAGEATTVQIQGGVFTLDFELASLGQRLGRKAAELKVKTSGRWDAIHQQDTSPLPRDKFRVTSAGTAWVELANGVPLEVTTETTYEADRMDTAYKTVTRTTLTRVEGTGKAPAPKATRTAPPAAGAPKKGS